MGGAAAPNAASQGLPPPPQQQEGQQFSSGPVTPRNGRHRPRAGPPRGPGAGQRQPQPAKGDSGTARHRSTLPGPPAAREREAAASGSPSSAVPPPAQPPAAGPSLPTCPSAPPCYCGRGGGPTPAAASSASPSASATALPVPLPAPTGGGSGDAPPHRHLEGSEGRGFPADILSAASRPPSSMRRPGAAISVVATVQPRPAPRHPRWRSPRDLPRPQPRPRPPCSHLALQRLAGRVSADPVTGQRSPGQTPESIKCLLRYRDINSVF